MNSAEIRRARKLFARLSEEEQERVVKAVMDRISEIGGRDDDGFEITFSPADLFDEVLRIGHEEVSREARHHE